MTTTCPACQGDGRLYRFDGDARHQSDAFVAIDCPACAANAARLAAEQRVKELEAALTKIREERAAITSDANRLARIDWIAVKALAGDGATA